MNLNDVAKTNQTPPSKKAGLVVAGVLAFPLALAAGIALALTGIGLYAIGVTVILWIIILRLLYGSAGLREPSKVIGLTVGVGTLMLVGEVVAGFALLFNSSGYINFEAIAAVYIVIAVIVSVALVRLLRNRGIAAQSQAPAGAVLQASQAPAGAKLQASQNADPGIFEPPITRHTEVTHDDQTPKPPTPPAV